MSVSFITFRHEAQPCQKQSPGFFLEKKMDAFGTTSSSATDCTAGRSDGPPGAVETVKQGHLKSKPK